MLSEDLCWSGEGVFRQNEKNEDQAVSFSTFTLISVTAPRFLGCHTLLSVKWFWGCLLSSILKLGQFRAKPISTIVPLAIVIFFFNVTQFGPMGTNPRTLFSSCVEGSALFPLDRNLKECNLGGEVKACLSMESQKWSQEAEKLGPDDIV